MRRCSVRVSVEGAFHAVGRSWASWRRRACVTTGSPGRFDTPWGSIEFTHTDRDIKPEIDVYPRDNGVLEASLERAARDLRRVGRNTGLIDEEVLADALSEERHHKQQGHQP
jgi:hypothetical protein